MRILMIGDIVGRPGRYGVSQVLPALKAEYSIDFVVANGENAAAGFGITSATANELLTAGVDVITSGAHIWDQREIIEHMNDESLPLLRPLNYPPGVPGRGSIRISDTVGVVNLMCRVFVGNFDDPFQSVDHYLQSSDTGMPLVILVDFHAEATSEKAAMGWYLDGRVSALVGTHTHVATCDHRILPKGTAYVSDLGMVGPMDSIIGSNPTDVLARFLTQMPGRLKVASGDMIRFNSVMIDIDENTGRAEAIERLDRIIEYHER